MWHYRLLQQQCHLAEEFGQWLADELAIYVRRLHDRARRAPLWEVKWHKAQTAVTSSIITFYRYRRDGEDI
jgi:hypothetical protein